VYKKKHPNRMLFFFWKNISLPPETKFYKENISELESLYGVSIETQFQYSN